MVTNTYLGWRRRAWFHRSVPVAELPERAMPDPTESVVVRQELWSRLGTLPARQRAAVVLRYYEDLDDAAIAEILGCSLSTVRSLVFRAIEALRRTTGSEILTGRTGGAR